MRRTTLISLLLCLAIQLFAAKGWAKSLKLKIKLIDASGGKWTNEAAFAFRFSETYSIDLQFGTLCLQRGTTKALCKGASIKPDASATATFSDAALTKLGIANREALHKASQKAQINAYMQIGRKRYPVLTLWPGTKAYTLRGIAVTEVDNIDKGVKEQLRNPMAARLVYHQLSHMYSERQDKQNIFTYLPLQTPKPQAKKKPTSRPSPTSKPAANKPAPAPQKQGREAWLAHLKAWTEFIPYQQLTAVCADKYTPKQALKNLNALQTTQKSNMLRYTRKVLKLTATSFRALGDSKVSGLLTVATDGIRLCQWSAFFAAAYLKYHSTNAKRAFWKEKLISEQGFTIGLITAFTYRFARNLIEDVGKIIVAAQKVGHYGMVVAAWLLGKKYTGLTNMFCSWKRAKTLCKVVGTAIKIGHGTYRVLKSGYRISAKGVVLTIRYSKKLYYGIKGVYYYFKGRPRKGKAYCKKLARAGAFFRAEGVSLAPADWSPKVCQIATTKPTPKSK